MANVLRVFEDPIRYGKAAYIAQVCGRQNEHGLWEGWIEFRTVKGRDRRRTGRETTQPDFTAIDYWAGGLSTTYLEGALARTFEPPVRLVPRVPGTPIWDGPAPRVTDPTPTERAVLDPFSVATKGIDLLRAELMALRGWHLRNIIRRYQLADRSTDLSHMSEAELIELIINAVQPAGT